MLVRKPPQRHASWTFVFFNMRWGLGRPPPPPPETYAGLGGHFTAILVIVYSTYTVALVALHQGRLGQVKVAHAPRIWLCVLVFTLLAAALHHGATSNAFFDTFSDRKLDQFTLFYLAVRLMPIAGFGMLLVSEVCAALFASGGPNPGLSHMRHPSMVVHACSLIYYVNELFLSQEQLTDAFDRQIYPLRYVLWTISVSCMLVSMYFGADCALRLMGALPNQLNALHVDLTTGLLYCNGTFAAGFLAGLQYGKHWLQVNALLFCVSSYYFYAMMHCIDGMLARTQESAAASGAARAAWQFAVTRKAIWTVWHIFPIVWGSAACQAISTETEHMGYIFSDISAKFLLMFVYMACVNEQIVVSRQRVSPPQPAARDLASATSAGPPVIGQPVSSVLITSHSTTCPPIATGTAASADHQLRGEASPSASPDLLRRR